MSTIYKEPRQQYSEEIEDIISKPPAWLLRWGLSLFFSLLLLICSLSAFIKYPDVIKTQMRISVVNAPKPIVSLIKGKLFKILRPENEHVVRGELLAYLESEGNHEQILRLLDKLKRLQEQPDVSGLLVESFEPPQSLTLGELKLSYLDFYQAYSAYVSGGSSSVFMQRKRLLQKELDLIKKQQQKLQYQLKRPEKDDRAGELKQGAQAAQVELALINISYSIKEREIMDLDTRINTERTQFYTRVNALIEKTERWKKLYVLSATQTGKLVFAANLTEKGTINANEEIFYIKTENASFYGEMAIPQLNMGKVRLGQEVLVKLKSYPFEEYGMIRGKVASISDMAVKGELFLSKVTFNASGNTLKKGIQLKEGMVADAEIMTEDSSLLHRLSRNVIHILN